MVTLNQMEQNKMEHDLTIYSNIYSKTKLKMKNE